MILFSALVTSFLFSFALSKWNTAVASEIYQWSSDPKNIYICVSKLVRPELLSRDFPFADKRVFSFYQPLYIRLAVFLSRWAESVLRATRLIHFIFTFICLLGWMTLVLRLTANWFVGAIALLAVVPFISVISADGISVGAPATWWSRSMANAFIPWFFVLAHLHLSRGGLIFPLALLTCMMFYFHPTAAVGLLGPLAYIMWHSFGHGLASPWAIGSGIAVLAVGFAPFSWSYLKKTLSSLSGSSIDVQHVNRLAFERFELWPYPLSLPALFRRHNRLLHIIVGLTYTLSVALIWLLRGWIGDSFSFYALLSLNLVVLVFVHLRPGVTLGLCLSALAVMGSAHFVDVFGLVSVSFILAALVLSRLEQTRVALAAVLMLVFSMLVFELSASHYRDLLFSRIVRQFDWFLSLSIALVFLSYFWGCLFVMDLWPIRMGKPLVLIDWGRIVKVAQAPMYIYVFYLINDVATSFLRAEAARTLWAAVPLVLLILCVIINWRRAYRKETPTADLALFNWAVGTEPSSKFHVVSRNAWLAFNFRANTLRSITGSWKDGGICFYSDPLRFLEWKERMDMISRAADGGDLREMAAQARLFGADYLIADKEVIQDRTGGVQIAYANDRYKVIALSEPARV